MTIKTVTVFGASGRQGQTELRELIAQGSWPRAASRSKNLFSAKGLNSVAMMAACDFRQGNFCCNPQTIRHLLAESVLALNAALSNHSDRD